MLSENAQCLVLQQVAERGIVMFCWPGRARRAAAQQPMRVTRCVVLVMSPPATLARSTWLSARTVSLWSESLRGWCWFFMADSWLLGVGRRRGRQADPRRRTCQRARGLLRERRRKAAGDP